LKTKFVTKYTKFDTQKVMLSFGVPALIGAIISAFLPELETATQLKGAGATIVFASASGLIGGLVARTMNRCLKLEATFDDKEHFYS